MGMADGLFATILETGWGGDSTKMFGGLRKASPVLRIGEQDGS